MTDINIKTRARSGPGKYDIVSYGTKSIVVIVITIVCLNNHLSIYICAIRLSYITSKSMIPSAGVETTSE